MAKDIIKALKAELELAKKEQAEALANSMEEIRLKQEISRATNPLVQRFELQKQNNQTLDTMLEFMETELDIVIRPVYGYGNIVSKLLTVARSVMFCKFDQKTEALLATKTDESVIEDLLDALGNTCYYSKEAREIVPAVECNYGQTYNLLELMANQMGLLEADLSKFSKKNIKYQYASAELRAKQMMSNSLALEDGQEDVVYED